MFKNETFEPVKAVLLSEEEGNVSEIDLDISSEKREIFKLLKGPTTFIGMCYEMDVIAMKCRESVFDLLENRNKLPKPFDKETDIFGPVLFLRMNEESEPKDFTLKEFNLMYSV
jgi:hypothetical protein